MAHQGAVSGGWIWGLQGSSSNAFGYNYTLLCKPKHHLRLWLGFLAELLTNQKSILKQGMWRDLTLDSREEALGGKGHVPFTLPQFSHVTGQTSLFLEPIQRDAPRNSLGR